MENINANNSAKKDIIIKCSVEEMVKAFFNDYVIIWHDPNVHSEENQQYIARLRQFCEVLTFTEWERAATYTKEAKAVCHIITSGTNGELIIDEISASQSVVKMYVFCRDKAYHSTWAQNYPKVSCVETRIETVLSQIEQNLLEWYKEASSLKLNLPAFAPIFNDSDKSEMNHLHRYLRVIPKFDNRQQAKDDFVTLSKKIYSDQENVLLLKEFENNYKEYNKEQILRWYTQNSFLYRVTNNCLRIATSDSIQYSRLILKDIEQAIKDQYKAKSKNFSGLLYRGAYLSQEEWSSLKTNQDKEIEMHGFLSVSKEKKVALNFMRADPSKKVFITIIVPKGPNEEEQGFAEIEEFSEFQQEKEILFNVRSRFIVLETEDDYVYSGNSRCRHLVLLYGAHGFRQLIAEKNPCQEVSISDIENISCAHCKVSNGEMPGKMLYISFADPKKQAYSCKGCLDFGISPFLCIQKTMDYVGKSYATKVKGCSLMVNQSQGNILFYGYKCCNCQVKKLQAYFVCTDCDIKWCDSCFENVSKCREIPQHNIILETSPFSFWCERMSANDLNHLEFQKNLVKDSVSQQAQMYFESHQYEKAVEYYSLYIQENGTNPRDGILALSYNNIGLVCYNQGEYNKALDYYSKSLDIKKSVLGDNHPSTAASYNNIGSVYDNQGEYNKALEYYSKSLDIRKSVLGYNHPDTAASYNNIGAVYKNQGEYNKALEYYSKSLDIKKCVLGDNHPSTAGSYNNIAGVYHNQGEYNKALEYYSKSLDIYKSILGDNHPSTATSYNNIGVVYDNQGEYNKALEYCLKSLDIYKSILGDNHPDTAASYNNLGLVYKNQGEYNKALEYYSKSLDIYKSVLGDNHPSTAGSYNNIGLVYDNQGEYNKALEYYLKSLDIRKSVLGYNHPSTATSYNNIGSVYQNQGEYNKALEYYSKSLDIRKSVLGYNHPDTAASYNNLGLVYKNQGEYNKALEYHSKSLDISKSVLGDNHPSTAGSYHNIGVVYKNQGEYDKAFEYYSKSLGIRKSVLGDNHPDTIAVQNLIKSIPQNMQ